MRVLLIEDDSATAQSIEHCEERFVTPRQLQSAAGRAVALRWKGRRVIAG
jgi:hypothetical protein